MVVLAVTWVANPGKEEEVADVFRKLESAARQEPSHGSCPVLRLRAVSGRCRVSRPSSVETLPRICDERTQCNRRPARR